MLTAMNDGAHGIQHHEGRSEGTRCDASLQESSDEHQKAVDI